MITLLDVPQHFLLNKILKKIMKKKKSLLNLPTVIHFGLFVLRGSSREHSPCVTSKHIKVLLSAFVCVCMRVTVC